LRRTGGDPSTGRGGGGIRKKRHNSLGTRETGALGTEVSGGERGTGMARESKFASTTRASASSASEALCPGAGLDLRGKR